MRSSFLLLLPTLLSSLAARAETDPGNDHTREASRHFSRGLELVDQQAYRSAVEEFLRAYELRPHASVLYNVGMAYAKAGEPALAADALERFMASVAGDSTQRRQAAAKLHELEEQTGEVEVETKAGATSVDLDGEPLGKTPVRKKVSAGKHRLTLTPAQGAPEQILVEVKGRATVHVLLPSGADAGATFSPSPEARLALACEVPDVRVEIDAADVGRSSFSATLVLAPGRHQVRFKTAGGAQDETVVLREGEQGRLVCNAGLLAAFQPPTPPHPVCHHLRGPATAGLALALGLVAGGMYVWNESRYVNWLGDRYQFLGRPTDSPTWESDREALNSRKASIENIDKIVVGTAAVAAAGLAAAGWLWVHDASACGVN